ncbi:MAG: hypothetical protein FJX76_21140 [Armatimonadetes bacterium]|nr:hypothetical protein [Armatimonadota bacterium]
MTRRAIVFVLTVLILCVPLAARSDDKAAHLTVDDEIKLGAEAASIVRKRHGGTWNNPAQKARVEAIFRRLITVSDRREVAKLRGNYTVELLNTEVINAMALPGGTTFVTRGLLELSDLSDDELAGVMGHEIAHAARRHGALNVESMRGMEARIKARTQRRSLHLIGKVLAFAYLHKRLDPNLEFEADYYGMIYASRAGYSPNGLVTLFERFEKLEKGGGARKSRWKRALSSLLDNHPPTAKRIERGTALAEKLKRNETVKTTPVPVYN